MTSVGDPLVGQVLDGRYQITQRLARGGMATVYQAVDMRLTRTVAVKVMHIGLGDDAEFARKFDREARASARLSHPNVVSVFDQGHDASGPGGGRPYIVMEYVDGQTLRDVISREAPLTPLRALEMIEPVLSALACAHDAGLVHRDVKPENVLISDRGQIKVADFGLAKAISAQTSTATQGLLIGTVSYLPPELVVSGRADARSDVYSAGVVLFELITGQKPHTGETPIQVAYAHVHTDVPPPSTFTTAGPIPPYLDALMGRVTARDPDVRPPDAKVMLTLVRRVRAALRDGAVDDEELTQDLTIPDHLPKVEPSPPDRADFEVTQLVQAAPPPAQERKPRGWEDSDPQREHSWPTVRDAPPPPVARAAHPVAHRADDERRRVSRNRRRGWLALLIVLLLTATAALAGWYYTDGRFTSAPALSSLSQSQAEELAHGAGLDVVFEPEYSESVAKGTVISSSPGPGEKIIHGGKLAAIVSQGPERYAMPKVVGLSQDAAESALAKANLEVGRTKTDYSETVAKGIVLKASQTVGTLLKKESVVYLTVSDGPKPIKIANFVNESADKAESALKKAGFKVKVTTANSASVAAGLVINQSPSKGSGKAGDTITLQQSIGPVMVVVPNVRRMGIKAATKVIKAAGFKVRTKPVLVNFLDLGYVAYTKPGARGKAPEGSTITLYTV
ncbi:MAG: Stk1 family PASTA domain-containing Ser/Thr kinase [Propionibacteriaceae bacterium]